MKRISVVIPTLGGKSLSPTLEKLNSGTLVPDEILLCIPTSESKHSDFLIENNIRVIPTPTRGQVAQRAHGFREAKYDYILQLDDDISVDLHCLNRLVDALKICGANASVSPSLIDEKTRRSVYEKPKWPRFLFSFYFWLMNGTKGYKPGTIDMAGTPVGVDPAFAGSRFVEVEWLAGGCILHRRENLVVEDFWERPGKAYCEDLLHSHLLRQRGISLFVDTSARCELEVLWHKEMTFKAFVVDLYRDFCARKYYTKQVSRAVPRIYWFYLVRFAGRLWGVLRWRGFGI